MIKRILIKNNSRRGLKQAGFTLMELLIVLAIFTVIMSVALFNQAGLSSSVLVTNLAYETALAIREAQTYGISVRASSAVNDPFDKGYGVYFEMNSPDRIVVFGDANNDKIFSDTAELQSLYEIKNQRGNKIKSISYTNSGALTTLGSSDRLSIMFKRPNPEAAFYKIDTSGGLTPLTGPIKIIVGNTENTNCRAVVVEITGQIRVEQTQCVPTP